MQVLDGTPLAQPKVWGQVTPASAPRVLGGGRPSLSWPPPGPCSCGRPLVAGTQEMAGGTSGAIAVMIVVLMRVPQAPLDPGRPTHSPVTLTPSRPPRSRGCGQPSRSVAVTHVENRWRDGGPGPTQECRPWTGISLRKGARGRSPGPVARPRLRHTRVPGQRARSEGDGPGRARAGGPDPETALKTWAGRRARGGRWLSWQSLCSGDQRETREWPAGSDEQERVAFLLGRGRHSPHFPSLLSWRPRPAPRTLFPGKALRVRRAWLCRDPVEGRPRSALSLRSTRIL